MGRRRKGRDLSGWLVVDKPAGLTSNAVLGRVRHAFGAAKAGHTGTLDPAATGALPIAFGEATKTIPHASGGWKVYRFTIRLGAATDTDDADGQVIARSDQRPTDDNLRDALEPFRGHIRQVPPAYSAVKVDGRRAYALTRDGATRPALAARDLEVAALDLVDRPDADHAVLEMTCGRGGYVRSVARDLGAALGCLAHVATLRRLATGPFDLGQARSLAEIVGTSDRETLDGWLAPVSAGLAGLTELPCDAAAADRLRHGHPVTPPCAVPEDTALWASLDGVPLAIGRVADGLFRPSRVLHV